MKLISNILEGHEYNVPYSTLYCMNVPVTLRCNIWNIARNVPETLQVHCYVRPYATLRELFLQHCFGILQPRFGDFAAMSTERFWDFSPMVTERFGDFMAMVTQHLGDFLAIVTQHFWDTLLTLIKGSPLGARKIGASSNGHNSGKNSRIDILKIWFESVESLLSAAFCKF